MRLMSFFHTKAQFLDESKWVTRRKGWLFAKRGDVYCAVEKGQGLKKGEKVKRLDHIRVISVRRLRLDLISPHDVISEGFRHADCRRFVEMFCQHMGGKPDQIVTRIEFDRLHVSQEAMAA